MQGLYFLVFIVAFVVLFYWARKNDKVPLDRKTTGLLRMKDASAVDEHEGGPTASQAGRRTALWRNPLKWRSQRGSSGRP